MSTVQRQRKIAGSIRAVLIALAVLSAAVPKAFACQCVEQSPEQAQRTYPVIFEGRVTEAAAADGTDDRPVTFEVVQQWRGVDQEEVIVLTSALQSMCGVPFEVDTSWLVYAQRANGQLTTSICSRTRLITAAEEDLELLGAGEVPVEITEEDEPAPNEMESAQVTPRGGCASCRAVGDSGSAMSWTLAILLIGLWSRRRANGRE